MKTKGKKITAIVAALCSMTVVSFAACACNDKGGGGGSEEEPAHVHNYGTWQIVADPTEQSVGKALRFCTQNDGGSEYVDIPALTDTSVWSLTTDNAAGHETAGSKVYASVYGNVTVAVPATGHNYGKWEIVEEPTCTEDGVITRSCSCGASETVHVAAHDHDFSANVWAPVSSDDDDQVVDEEEGYDVPSSDLHAKVCSICHMLDVEHAEAHENGDEWFSVDSYHKTIESHYTCEVCGHVSEGTTKITGVISGYTPVAEESKAATYTEAGYTTYELAGTSVKFKITEPKLVAPYEGKTYSAIQLQKDSEVAEKNPGITSRDTAVITFDDKGNAKGESFPFRGDVVANMIDASTGKVEVTVTDGANPSEFIGYIEPTTGIMVVSKDNFNDVYVISPYSVDRNNIAASYWTDAMAMSYHIDCGTYTGHEIGIFVQDGVVYFGVTFNDENNAPIVVADCFNEDFVEVKAADGAVVATCVRNSEDLLQLSDAFRGVYMGNEGTLNIDGCGRFTLGSESGVYEIEQGRLDAFVIDNGKKVKHYELECDGDGYTLTHKTVTVTLDKGDHGTLAQSSATVYTDCVPNLPIPTVGSDGYIFIGWKDENGELLEDDFVFTESASLTAQWAEPITVTVQDENGTITSVVVSVVTPILSKLPNYTKGESVNTAGIKFFDGWYTDNAYTKPLAASAVPTAGVAVYAKWVEIPVYAGDYYGTEIWNKNGGNSSKKQIKIDYYGKVTDGPSEVKGSTAKSYDKATQTLTLTKSNGSDCTVVLDSDAGIIAGYYSNITGGLVKQSDINVYVSSLTNENYKFTKSYGVQVPASADDSTIGYYLQLIQTKTKLGDDTIVAFYNGKILSGITMTDLDGNALNFDTLKNSSSLVLKSSSGVALYSFGVQGGGKIDSSKCVFVDEYRGNYTSGGIDIVVDGMGGVTIGDKSGVYVKTDGGLGVSIMNNGVVAEYYDMTLDKTAGTATLNKPMITITYSVPAGCDAVASKSVNKNAAIGAANLPDNTKSDTSDGKVFAGWYTKDGTGDDWGEQVTANTTFAEDVTLYAMWKEPHALSGIWKGNKTSYSGFSNAVTLTVDLLGNITDGISTFKNKTVTMGVDGAFTIEVFVEGDGWYSDDHTDYYYGYIDSANGVMAISTSGESSKKNNFSSYVYVLKKVDSADDTVTLNSIATWGSCYLVTASVDSSESTFVITADKIRVGATFTVVDFDGNAVAAAGYKTQGNLLTVNYDDQTVVKVYDGSSFVDAKDGYRGAYTESDNQKVYIDGAGKIKVSSKDGSRFYSYNTVTENKLGVTISNVYYEVALNTADHTCTVSKPEAVVNYEVTHGAVPDGTAQRQNINVEFTLPTVTPESGYQFLGWYKDAAFTQLVEGSKTTLTSTDAVRFYAKVEPMPNWASKDTAETVAWTEGALTVSAETSVANLTYYAKIEIAEDGLYAVYAPSATKTGGSGKNLSGSGSTTGSGYARFSLLDSTGNALSDVQSMSFGTGSINVKYVTMTQGTYYLQVHLGGNVAGSSYNYEVCGTFTVHMAKAEHATVDTAKSYTVGTSESVTVKTIGDMTMKAVYTVSVKAGIEYKASYTVTGKVFKPLYVYSNKWLTASVATPPGSWDNGTECSFNFTPTADVTYYIEVSDSISFSITEVTA